MMPINPFDNLVKEVLGGLPASAEAFRADLTKTLRANLEAGLKKMDLVTRDEFEAQRAVLEKARQQITLLESKLAELEQRANLDK